MTLPPRFLGLPALALLLATSAASANVVATDGTNVTYDDVREGPAPRRVEGRIGMLISGSDVGDADGFSIGMSAGVGYRIGDLTLRGLFDYYRVGDSSDEAVVRRGRGTRVGGAVRYSFANTGDARHDGGVGVDFWGGEVAIGFELDGQGERTRHGRRHIGYFMDFRSLIAQGPEMPGPAVCGGPCTRATTPSRTDVSMFFELGLHWGR